MDPEAVENTDPLLIVLSEHCCCVETLNLNSCNLTAEGLLALKEMNNLQSLSLCFCEVMNQQIFSAVCEPI